MKVKLKHLQLGRELARSRLSQNAWARRLGLSSGHLANLVNGKRPYPDPGTRERLLKGLDLRFDQLFEVEEPSATGTNRPTERSDAGAPAGEQVDRPNAVQGEETFMTGIAQDFRLGFRAIGRHPGFSLAVTIVLFLGIGATTIVFSLLHSVMIRPLPFQDSGQLYLIWEGNPDRNWHQVQVSSANFIDLKRQNRIFENVAAYNDYLVSVTFLSNGVPHRLQASQVTGDFFSVLGVAPVNGRLFDPSETWEGGEAVALLSHRIWEDYWQMDPGLIGRSIELNGVACRVVGILPPEVEFPFKEADLWLPTQWSREAMNQVSFRRAHGMRAVGRLKAGISPAEAEANLEEISSELARLYPETNRNGSFGLTPLQDWILGETDRYLWLLLGAVSLLLVIACSNVANMLLALWAGRSGEIAVRMALGAGRRRISQQAVIEALLLCLPAGVLALIATWGTIGYLRVAGPEHLPRLSELSVDWTVLVVSSLLVVGCSLVFGLLPARRYSSRAPALELHQQGRGGNSPAGHFLSRTLLAAQVALALLLLAGGGLFARSFWNLNAVDPGFQIEHGVVFGTRLPPNEYSQEAAILSFYDRLGERLAAVPGVESVSFSSRVPFLRQRYSSDFTAEGWEEGRFGVGIRHGEVMAGYFRTMGIPILRGREFTRQDRSDSPGVAVISEGLAREFFADEDPIGRRITFTASPTPDSRWWEIVGIAGDVRRLELSSPARPEVYVPYAQDWSPGRSMYGLIRSRRDAGELFAAARRAVIDLDPNLPIFDPLSLEEIRSRSLAERRFFLLVLLIFALASCTMSVAGVYGVLSHYLARRRKEMGVRTALGASRADLVRDATRGGMKPVALGLLVGLALSALLTQTVRSLLYQVDPLDAATLFLSVLVLTSVSLIGCLIPAYRASRIDPLTSLREE